MVGQLQSAGGQGSALFLGHLLELFATVHILLVTATLLLRLAKCTMDNLCGVVWVVMKARSHWRAFFAVDIDCESRILANISCQHLAWPSASSELCNQSGNWRSVCTR